MNTQISSVYGIQGPVDFLDVHVDRDNKLFIDPSRIRHAAQQSRPYAQSAYNQLINHFNEILFCIRSASSADQARGERLMQRYKEPNETRLGMSVNGVHGHGAADELGSHIWSELVNNPLCQAGVAILKRIEDIPLFVDGVDADITSDLTTRVIAPALAKFTKRMMTKHPEFSSNGTIAAHPFETWDPAKKAWIVRTFDLPVADGEALLLVPRGWVGLRLLMAFGQYYQRPLLGEIQSERTVWVPGPKGPRAIKPTKKSLQEESSLTRSRDTCIAQTSRIAGKGKDLVEVYRQDADERAVASVAEKIAGVLRADIS